MTDGGDMITVENIKYELSGRLRDLPTGKSHISVRYERGSRIARIGACITNYDWDTREAVVDALLDYEDAHADEFAVEFDVIPLEAVNDVDYAEI